MLLGAILHDNRCFDAAADFLRPEHFSHEAHGDVLAACASLIQSGKSELVMVCWGLNPFWAKNKDIGYQMNNARAETVAEKPAFCEVFKCRRCLVIADGFCEWQKRR